jgi:hypothetical protein
VLQYLQVNWFTFCYVIVQLNSSRVIYAKLDSVMRHTGYNSNNKSPFVMKYSSIVVQVDLVNCICLNIWFQLPGLLLRQIKDFWRVALFTSTLLNPGLDPSNDNFDISEGLDRRRDMFLRTESAITQLGNPRIFPLWLVTT